MLYGQHCATCHGIVLEGQSKWRERLPNGRLPAPPHNETGHAWHDPDAVLFAVTRHGMVPPYAPLGYQSDMPAFGAVPSEVEIRVVLATGTSSGTSAAKIRLEADFCACGCHPRPCPGRNIRPMPHPTSHADCVGPLPTDTNRFIDMGCTFCVMPRSNGGPFSDRWWRGQLSWSGTGGSV